MKRNFIFVILTAMILALGFYGADIIGHFLPDETAEQVVVARDRSNTNAVYLKEENEQFSPMSLVVKKSQYNSANENTEVRVMTAAMITAMSSQNEKTAIVQPAGQELDKALQFDKTGYVYVEKWQYINSKKQTRFLDCIVWTNDMSIAYIRFYNGDNKQLSGTEMNNGLDRLNNFSDEFYPNISDSYYQITDFKSSYGKDAYYYDRPQENNPELNELGNIMAEQVRIEQLGDAASVLHYTENKYNSYSQYINTKFGISENQLYNFWLSQLAFEDLITSQNYSVMAGNKITDLLIGQYGVWVKPSYSAKDGIIYQTITAGTHEVTVIYNVRDSIIEGFYFPDCAEIPSYLVYSDSAFG